MHKADEIRWLKQKKKMLELERDKALSEVKDLRARCRTLEGVVYGQDLWRWKGKRTDVHEPKNIIDMSAGHREKRGQG